MISLDWNFPETYGLSSFTCRDCGLPFWSTPRTIFWTALYGMLTLSFPDCRRAVTSFAVKKPSLFLSNTENNVFISKKKKILVYEDLIKSIIKLSTKENLKLFDEYI